MSTPTIVVLVTVAVVSVVALGVTLLALGQYLRGLTTTLERLRDELDPVLTQLSEDAEVTARELERVSEAADELRRSRGGGAAEPEDSGP